MAFERTTEHAAGEEIGLEDGYRPCFLVAALGTGNTQDPPVYGVVKRTGRGVAMAALFIWRKPGG